MEKNIKMVKTLRVKESGKGKHKECFILVI